MNANELADELADTGEFFEDALYLKAATMILRQQAEIEALKERMRPCQPLCKPSVCDCRPLNQTYDPKKHGAE